MFETTQVRLRQRRLAGDDRAGHWVRGDIRRRQWEFVGRGWPRLALIPLGAGLITAILLAFVDDAFWRGLLVGSAVVGTLAVFAGVVQMLAGTAPASMGAAAEQWTAGELRQLRSSGWLVVNHFGLGHGDIDHVLVGPTGVIAVETKWSARGWKVDPPADLVLAAVDQARRHATELRLWHELRSRGVQSVQPVVFLWGGSGSPPTRPSPGIRRVAEVTLVHGADAARSWRESVVSSGIEPVFDTAQIHDLWAALAKHARRRDEHERLKAPAPPSSLRIYVVAMSTVAAAVVAFFGCMLGVALAGWWPGGLVILAGAALGLAGRRIPVCRLPALSWLVGVAAASVLLLGMTVGTG